MTANRTRVGVAGWSYSDWRGIVYPQSADARFDPLVFLTHYFDTIEINSPFYRIPDRRTTSSWARRTAGADSFRFTVKLFKGFTHDRDSGPGDEARFKEALLPLVERDLLGALLLQFPFSYKNGPESRAHLGALLDRFADYPRVVEIRHASWNVPEFYQELTEAGVGFCNIDQPLIGRAVSPSQKATASVGYVRLHGRNYQDWFREDAGRDARYDYLYAEQELDPWIEKISAVNDEASETYVITNNHFRGQAVVNALQIRSRLEKRKVKAPQSLIESYPVLSGSAEPDPSSTPRQGRLF